MPGPEAAGPILNGLPSRLPDIDPDETAEWLASLDAAVDEQGRTRARYLMLALLQRARERGVGVPSLTRHRLHQHDPAGGRALVPRRRGRRAHLPPLAALERGDAGAPRPAAGALGAAATSRRTPRPRRCTRSASTTSSAAGEHPGGGDQVFIQGHASPGVYARAFLEGRLSADQLDGFRQERSHPGGGLSSYPHPRLMPDFWEFPTVSMGLGPMNAIYQAQFNKYLHARGIKDTSDQRVWAFLGDGEMDEPESRGLLQLASGEELDNLIFVVNCNLQRLDGPVRGNGKIIQELESHFRGAGWNVIKVVWGREWDPLLAADRDHALVHLMNTTPDGDYQTYRAENGAYIREHFFGRDPRTRKMVAKMSDDDIWQLKRGGHDYRKVYAAYRAATEHTGQPTVILAKTIKGYGLGSHFAGRNATHQMKKLTLDDLKLLRDSLRIPITDEQLEADPYRPPYYHPGEDDETLQYLRERRQVLGGPLPRRQAGHGSLKLPEDKAYEGARRGLRQAAGRDDDGVRPAAAGPHARQGLRRRASCRSSRTRRARSAWTRSSRPRRSTTRTGSSTRRSTAS